MIVRLPAVPESDFPAALVVSRLLESEDSPLALALAARSLPAPETGLEIAGGFSALRIHVACPDSLAGDCGEVPSLVRALADWRPDPASVEKAKTSFLSSEALDREMFHFYVMARGEAIALHGERYLEQVSDGVARVGAKDCARVLEKCFREPRWNACLVNAPERGGPPRGAAAETGAVETLPGGGVGAASRRPGSSAAAVHLAFRGRACAVDGRAPGLVELLMTVLEISPAGKALVRDLEALGARVAFGDNPYVPQDDYLLSPAFAFIRLEAPATRIAEAARLLGRFLAADAVSDEALAEARTALMGELGMRSGSPFYMMRGSMMKALFADHPFASPVFPPPPSMAGATADDLRSLRARFFAQGNVVATIVSPQGGEEARSILEGLVEGLPPGPAIECPALPDSAAPGLVEKKTRKEGAYLAACWFVRSASPAETAAAMVAGEILGRRMQLVLREKLGLAYSIDCGVSPLPGGAVIMAYLGTGAGRLDEARAALEGEIRGLAARSPGDEEIAIARNRLLGRRSRSELSSVNGAYALGLDVVLGDAAEPAALASAIAGTPRGSVVAVIKRSFVWERAVEIRLVPEKQSP